MPPKGGFLRRARKPTVKSVNRKVNRIISGMEKKRFVGILDTETINTGGSEWLTPITAGDQNNQRDGQSILAKSLILRYALRMNTASTHDNELVRILVIIDKQMDGATTAIATVIAQVTPCSPLSRGFKERFRVIYDKAHILNRFGGIANIDSGTRRFDVKLPVKNLKMFYSTVAVVQATGAGGEKNQVVLYHVSDATANGAFIDGSTDFEYTDN